MNPSTSRSIIDNSRNHNAVERTIPDDSLKGMNANDSSIENDAASSRSVSNAMVPLSRDFAPGDDDVICGRGKKCYNHVGNERFRSIVATKIAQYQAATSKLDKSFILSSIVAEVRKKSPHGGFVKKDPGSGRWYEVGDFLAREKTSQAFRDALHEIYRSSNKSKKKRRQEEQAKAASDAFSSKFQRLAVGRSQSGSQQFEYMLRQTNYNFLTRQNQSNQQAQPMFREDPLTSVNARQMLQSSLPNVHQTPISLGFAAAPQSFHRGDIQPVVKSNSLYSRMQPRDREPLPRRPSRCPSPDHSIDHSIGVASAPANSSQQTSAFDPYSHNNYTETLRRTRPNLTRGTPEASTGDILTQLTSAYGGSSARDDNPYEPIPIFEQSMSSMSCMSVDVDVDADVDVDEDEDNV